MDKEKRPFLSTPIFTVIGRAGGFVLPLVLAYAYGAGKSTDAYFLAFWLVYFLTGIFNHLLEAVAIPFYAEEKKQRGSIYPFANGIGAICYAGAWGFALTVAWVSFALPHFTGKEFPRLVGILFIEMSPVLWVGVLVALINGILYTEKIFWLPAVSPIFRSVFAILFLLIFHQSMGIHAASFGLGFGEILRGLISFAVLRKKTSWSFSISFNKVANQIRRFFEQVLFQVLSLAAAGLIPLTDQWFASMLGEGSVSLLNYSERIMFIPYQLVLMGIVHILHADWSEIYYSAKPDIFWPKILKDIKTVILVCCAFTAITWFLKYPIIYALYHFSNLPHEKLALISDLYGWLVLGFAPGVLSLLYSRILFVMKKAVFCSVYTGVQMLLNFILDFILLKFWGLRGICIGTTVIYFVTAFWLHQYLKPYWKSHIRTA